MTIQNKKLKLVTHDGSFHTDDIFACATLDIMLEEKGEQFEVTRTRDENTIKKADYVFDVGGIYDSKTNRFDHHQVGGAGRRVPSESEGTVAIEYASFGLVWKKFGVQLCGSEKAFEIIDKRLVAPVDAGDNGMSLFELKNEVAPYLIQSAFNSFNSGWKNSSEENAFSNFIECVQIAKKILSNEIARAQDAVEAEEVLSEIYQNTEDKRIIIIDKKYPYEQMQNYPEPIFVVYPRHDGSWGAEGVAVAEASFQKRKYLPKLWAGLRDEELQNVSGVRDATFCHRALFMAVAKSKEGAIKLAQIAVES